MNGAAFLDVTRAFNAYENKNKARAFDRESVLRIIRNNGVFVY
jgi:hypothetical protein